MKKTPSGMPCRGHFPPAAFLAAGVLAFSVSCLSFFAVPASSQTFSGDFSQPGGAVYDGGSNADFLSDLVVEARRPGGPYIYAAGKSQVSGDNRWVIVKYSSAGVKLASAAYTTEASLSSDQLYGLSCSSDGTRLFAVGVSSGGMSTLSRYDAATLSPLGAVTLAGEAYAVAADVSTSAVFVAGKIGGAIRLMKYTSGLVFVSSQVVRTFSQGVYNQRIRITTGTTQLYLEAGFEDSSGPGGVPNFSAYKYDYSLNMLSSAAFNGGGWSCSLGIAAAAAGSSIYVVGYTTSGPSMNSVIVKYSPTLSFVSSATVPGVQKLWSVGVDTMTGQVFAASLTDVFRFTPNLQLLSSANLGGGRAMGVNTSSAVYVAGDAFTKFVTKRINMNFTTDVGVLVSSNVGADLAGTQRTMARSSNGDLYLVHTKTYNGFHRIFLARSTNNGASWADTTAAPIETVGDVGAGYEQIEPSLAIDSQDRLHVVWGARNNVLDTSGGVEDKIGHIWAAVPGTSWSALEKLPGNSYQGIETRASIAVDDQDGLHVAWYGQNSGAEHGRVRYSSRSATSSGWAAYTDISYDSADTSMPSLVIDKNGIPHVLAKRRLGVGTGDYEKVVYSSRTAAGWGAWQQVFYFAGSGQRDVCLVADSSNTLHAVWTGTDATYPNNYQLKYASKTAGAANWSTNIDFMPIPSAPQSAPYLVLDSSGVRYVVWTGSDSVSSAVNIKISSSSDGAMWSAWTNITNSPGSRSRPSARWAGWYNNGGQLDFSWMEDVGGGNANLRAFHDIRATLSGGFIPSLGGVVSYGLSATPSWEEFFPTGQRTVRASNGDLYAIYTKPWSGRKRIFLARSANAGATWQDVTAGPIENDGASCSPGTNDMGLPALTIDSNDVLHAAWRSWRPGASGNTSCVNGIAYSSAAVPGISWSAVQKMTGVYPYIGYDTQPSMVVDSKNGVHLAWLGEDDANDANLVVRYSSRSASTGFGDYSLFPGGGIMGYSRPSLAMDANDVLHMVVPEQKDSVLNAPLTKILYSSKALTGPWSTPSPIIDLTATTRGQGLASIAVDASSGIHVVWQGYDDTYTAYTQIKYSSRTVQGPWSSWVNIGPINGSDQGSASIAIDALGGAHVVWQGSDTVKSVVNVKYSSRAAAGSWSAWTNLTDAIGPQSFPQLRWSGFNTHAGNLDLVWMSDEGAGNYALRHYGNAAAAMSSGFVAASSATGVTRIWSGTGADSLASNPDNWLGGVEPQPGDSIEFSTPLIKAVVMDFNWAVATTTVKSSFKSTITFTTDFMNTGNFIVQDGSLAEILFGAHEIKVGGDLDISSSAAFYAQASTLTFNGPGNQLLRRRGGLGYPIPVGNILVEKPAASRVQLLSDAVLYGAFDLKSGTFTTTYSMDFKGDSLELTGGSYLGVAGSTLIFSGAAPQSFAVVSGTASSFGAVRIHNPTQVTLDVRLGADDFGVFTGSTTVLFHQGYSYSFKRFQADVASDAVPAKLRSMTAGSTWSVINLTTSDVRGVDVQDSAVVPIINAGYSHDSGNNQGGWRFYSFSGSFSGSGVRAARLGGGNELVSKVLASTSTPVIYSFVKVTSSTISGEISSQDLLAVKYDFAGNLGGSRTLNVFKDDGDAAAMDPSGNLYVAARADDQPAILKLNSYMTTLASQTLSSSQASSIKALLYQNGYLYAACDGAAGMSAQVMRFTLSLSPAGSMNYYVGPGRGYALSLSGDSDGNVYLLTTNDTYVDKRVAKFNPDLTSLLANTSVSGIMGEPHSASIRVLGNGLFLAGYDYSGSTITLRKLDLGLGVLPNQFSVAGASAPFFGKTALGDDGMDLYLGGTLSGPNYGLFRLTPTLTLISSSAVSGGRQLMDIAVSSANRVYAAGVSTGADPDALIVRQTLAGTPPAMGLGFFGAAFDPSFANLWTSARKLDGAYRFTVANLPAYSTAAAGSHWNALAPQALGFDSGDNLWISASTSASSSWNTRLFRFDSGGSTTAVLSAMLKDPSALAFQPGTGDLWVAGRGPANSPAAASIVRYSRSGTYAAPTFSDAGASTFTTSAALWRPGGLAFDTAGNLWAASPSSGVIRMYPNSANFISTAPAKTLTAVPSPYALAFNADGDLFVSDTDPDLAPGNGKLWVFKNLGSPASPGISTAPYLLQSGVDILSMDFEGSGAGARLYGADFGANAILQLSTAVPQPPQLLGGISGEVEYSGGESGTFVVLVATTWPKRSFGDPGTRSFAAGFNVTQGTFSVASLSAPNTYYVSVFLDANSNYIPDNWEPRGAFRKGDAGDESVLPVYVTANSTAADVRLLLQDVGQATGTITNYSLQSGMLRVQSWYGAPNDLTPLLRREDGLMLNTSDYAVKSSSSGMLCVRAFVDSDYDGELDAGEDSASIGPLNITAGATLSDGTGIVIGGSAGGTVWVSTGGADLAPASLPTNVYDMPMLRIGLSATGGNAQLSSLRVSLLGDVLPMNVMPRIFEDVNGDGVFQSGQDTMLGSGSFNNGSPPVAEISFPTQTVNAGVRYFFIGVNYWSMPAGRKIGLAVDAADRFGLGYGQMQAQGVYPIESGLARVKLTIFARPGDGGYANPGPNPTPYGGMDSGVFLQAGQTVHVSAEGSWGTGTQPASDASGVAGYYGGLESSQRTGALLGRVGASQWFLLGVSTSFAAPQGGNLWLAMNDYSFEDDYGQLSLDIGLAVSSVTKVWKGASGINLNASLDSNWLGGGKPLPGESVLFDGSASTASCRWDLPNANIGLMTLATGYLGVVTLGDGSNSYTQLDVSSDVRVLNGTLDLGRSAEFNVSGRMLVSSGTLDFGTDNSRLRLGKAGMLVADAGTLRSAGSGWVSLQSLNGYDRVLVAVDGGTVDVRNNAGTEFNNAVIDLSTRAVVLNLDDVRFYAAAGAGTAAALTLHAKTPIASTFRDLYFGWGFSTNIDASDVAAGSSVTVMDAQGDRRGSPYELDPSDVVRWIPDGGGTAYISGVLDMAGTVPPGPFALRISTNPMPDSGETAAANFPLMSTGAYSSLMLQAPNTYYVFAWHGGTMGLPEGFAARGGYGHAGFFRSEPLFVNNGDSLSNIDVSIANWGAVQGSIYNDSFQSGPILLQPWIGTPQLAASTGSVTKVLSQWGGAYEFGAPQDASLELLAFVDINGNRFADEFEAQSTVTVAVSALSTASVSDIHIAGGATAPGGSLHVSTATAHPGVIAAMRQSPMLRLDLWNASTSSNAVLSGLRFNLHGGIPGRSYYANLWYDRNADGLMVYETPAGPDSEGMIGNVNVTAQAEVSSAALSIYSAQILAPGTTRVYLLTLSPMSVQAGVLSLSLSATDFTLSQGAMEAQPALYPVLTPPAQVRYAVEASAGANYNGPNSGGQYTGLRVEPGLSVVVSATGTWQMNGSTTGPAGLSGTQYQGTVLPEARVGELIARVGDWNNGTNWVRVGVSTSFVSFIGGDVFLAANDYAGDYYNNSGFLLADISVTGSTMGVVAGSVAYQGGADSGAIRVYAQQTGMMSSVSVSIPIGSFTWVGSTRVYSYSIDSLPPGSYNIEAQSTQYGSHRGKTPVPVYVAAGGTVTANVQMALGYGVIEGTIAYASGLQSYGDYRVFAATVTDFSRVVFLGQLSQPASGPFSLGSLPSPATYYLAAIRDGNYNSSPDGAEPVGVFGISTGAFGDFSSLFTPIFVDTGATVQHATITLVDRGAISGQISRQGGWDSSPVRLLAGHGFYGTPGYAVENAADLDNIAGSSTTRYYGVGLLRPATDYSIFAFVDADRNGSYGAGELFGQSSALVSVSSGSYAGVDVYIQGSTVPPQIRNLSGTALSSSVIHWTWDGAPNAETYSLLTSSGGVAASVASSTTSYDQTFSSANSFSLIVAARASNAQGHGLASAEVPLLATLANAPGTILPYGTGASSAVFDWGRNGNSTYTVYEVVRATASGGVFSVVMLSTGGPVLDAGLSPSWTYHYRVQALNVNGVRSSTYAAAAFLTSAAAGNAISGSAAYSGRQSGWLLVQGATTALFSAGSIVSVATVPAGASSPYYLTFSGAGTYYARAFVDVDADGLLDAGEDRGQAGGGISLAGSPSSGNDFSVWADTVPPAAPVGLTAASSIGKVSLTWNAPDKNINHSVLTDLAGFRVQRAAASAGPFTVISTNTVFGATSAVAGTFFADTSPISGILNYYRVSSVDYGKNLGPYSGVVSIQPVAGGTLSGELQYSGTTSSGAFRVRLSTSGNPGAPFLMERGFTPFSFTGLADGTYYLRGFRDVNADGLQDLASEPSGVFGGVAAPFPVSIIGGNRVSSVTVRICDRNLLSAGVSTSAALSSSDCTALDQGPGYYTDLFTFRVGGGEAGSVGVGSEIELRLESAYSNRLFLLGPGGDVLSQDNRYGGASIRAFVNVPGIYIVEPTSFDAGGTGPYTLRMNLVGGFSGYVSGIVSYGGAGQITVQLMTSADASAFPVAISTIAAGGTYHFDHLPDGIYYARAFLDGNLNSVRDSGEPSGVYGIAESSPTAVRVQGGVCSVPSADFSVVAPAVGAVGGQILREGSAAGTIRVSVSVPKCISCQDFQEVAFATIPAAGPYLIPFLPPATSYLVRAFLDSNGNGNLDGLEAGVSSSPVTVQINSTTTVHLLLRDVGTGSAGNSSLQGSVTYASSTGPIFVGISADSNFGYIPYMAVLSTPGAFLKTGILGGTTYYLGAFLDRNGNGSPDERLGEPNASIMSGSSPTPFYVPPSSAVVVSTPIALSDPPAGAVSGKITYNGSAPLAQPLIVQASASGIDRWGYAQSSITRLAGTGGYAYRLDFLAAATSYSVTAFIDANGNGRSDYGEPFAQYGQVVCPQGPCYGVPVAVSSGAGVFPTYGVDFEVRDPGALGTDFGNTGEIRGNVVYLGVQGGPVMVRIFDNANYVGAPVRSVSLPAAAGPGDFTFIFQNLPVNATYYVDAFRDTSGSGILNASFQAYGRLGSAALTPVWRSREVYGDPLTDPGPGGSVNVFSGRADLPGGARFDGGATDIPLDLLVDATGSVVYVLGTTFQNAGTELALVKYSSAGVFISSVSRGSLGGGVLDRFAVDAGVLFAGRSVLGSGGEYLGAGVQRLNAAMLPVAETVISSADGVSAMAARNGAIYVALGSAWSGNIAHKIDAATLVVSATAAYSFPSQAQSQWITADAIGVDGAGSAYVLARRRSGSGVGDMAAIIKFDPAMTSTTAFRDIGYIDEIVKDGASMAVDPSGNVVLSYSRQDAAGPSVVLQKFDANLTPMGSAAYPGVWVHFRGGLMDLVCDNAGSLYRVAESSVNAGDFLALRYDGGLSLLAERAFDAKDRTLEDIGTAVGVWDSSNVYVAGTVNNGTNLDWALIRVDMNAGGSQSAAGSGGGIVLEDTLSGMLRYGGVQASSGTMRAHLFPMSPSAPLRSSTAPFSSSSSYLFNRVPAGNYLIRAFIDKNDNYLSDVDEPLSFSAASGFAFAAGGNSTGPALSFCDRNPIVPGTDVSGVFLSSDCVLADRAGAFGQLYSFAGTRGQNVSAELTAVGFYDGYLNLYGPDGRRLASDDDGAGAGNARISNMTLSEDGVYTLAASPFSPGVTGSFLLKLSGSAGGALGSISGNITYNGSQGAQIKVGLFSTQNFAQDSFVRSLDLAGSGAYLFDALKTGSTYYVGAFSDVNFNGAADPGEDSGSFGSQPGVPDPLYLRPGQSLGGVDFSLAPSTSAAASQAGVTGRIHYGGALAGALRVELWPDAQFSGRPIAVRSIPAGAGPYDADYDVSAQGGQPYYVRAYIDVDGDFLLDPEEPRGVYQPMGQGVQSVYVPLTGSIPGVDFSVQDAFLNNGSAFAAGEGSAVLSSTAVRAGTLLASVTVQVVVGPSGIVPSAGRIVFGVPMGWMFPQTASPGMPGYVFISTANNPDAAYNPVVQSAVIPGAAAMELSVVSSTPLYGGATVQFVYANVYVPCYAADGVFRVGTLSSGTAQGARPMPVLSGEPRMTLLAGDAQYFQLRGGYLGVLQGQVSPVQVLEGRDSCGNSAAVRSDTVVHLRGKRYQSGSFADEPALAFSSVAVGQFLSVLSSTFSEGAGSRTFVLRSSAVGEMSIEVSSGAQTYYAGVGVLPADTLSNVSVATVPYLLGRSSAVIVPNGDPSSPNQAYVNFDLGTANLGWSVAIASIPYKESAFVEPLWQSWGNGAPARGQIAWDGRYSPWINGGGRVPTGVYYLRVEVGAGVRDESLQVRVISPQLAGQVLDDGTNPRVPLSGAALNFYGPFGAQTVQSDARGGFILAGLSAGDYNLFAAKDSYLPGSGRLHVDGVGAVSTFTVDSADISLSTNSAGSLLVGMSRASSLFLLPSVSTDPAKPLQELWGALQVHAASFTRTFSGPLHLAAGATTFDDGGQWDPSLQRFATKNSFRFDVPAGTYVVRASLPGFDEIAQAGVQVGRGAVVLNLPAFVRRTQVSGTVTVPAGTNTQGTFVSVSAMPVSTSSQLGQGFGGVFLGPGVNSGGYALGGLQPGQYRLIANARGFAARTIPSLGVGLVDISTADFSFSDPGQGNVISGTVTVTGNTSQFPELGDGARIRVRVSAWAPGSMNFGQADVAVSTHGTSASANFHIRGLDPELEYQVFAWMEHHGTGDFDSPGGFPRRVVSLSAAPFKNAEGSLQFSFVASSGEISGLIILPEGNTDFMNVRVQGETLASARPDRVGEKFEVQVTTRDLQLLCSADSSVPSSGYCPAGNSSATFHVSNLNTETLDVLFHYQTSGVAKKYRVSVVNGLIASTTADLRITDVRSSTYTIAGALSNQIQNASFNTNEKIFVQAATVPLCDAYGRPWAIDPAQAARSTDSLARVVALRQEFGAFGLAVTTTANPATDRVGFLDAAGRFSITNVPSGVYFVRTADLRTCATCEILSPLTGQIVTVTSFSVLGVTITVRDGYNVSGSVSLEGGILDSKTLRLNLYNRRQEIVRSTTVALGNAETGSAANSVDYQFRNLPAGESYTLACDDISELPQYAGRPIKFPDPGLAPKGLQSDLTQQNLSLSRAAYITGKLKDAGTGENITKDNATLLAPNFRISASANPWVEGGYALAQASVSGRPVRYDGTFLVGPLIPDIAYDLKLTQDSWDLAFLGQGSQNYSPLTVSGLKPGPGEHLDAGTLSLGQGQSLQGRVRDASASAAALGNIKVTARPSFGDSALEAQTFTNGAGDYSIWVSTSVSQQYNLTFAPRGGNQASSGKFYRELVRYNLNVSTAAVDVRLTELTAQVTGQVLTEDGGALQYPFSTQKGYPVAAVFLQPVGVVPTENAFGDILVQTDEHGMFSVPGLSTGTYSLRAASLGYSVLNASVAVSTSSFCISTSAASGCLPALTLRRGAVVSGRILLPSGSAPSAEDVGGVVAANRGFTEFVVGSVEIDLVAKTVSGYTLSGFKPEISYDIVLLPREGDEISFPPEGRAMIFSAEEAMSAKSLNLTYAAARPDCEAGSKALGNGQFQIRIACSRPLRRETSADDDLDSLLTLSTANSLGAPIASPDGTGQLLGGDKHIESDRRVITAVYRSAAGESRFSLKLAAYTQNIDPTTGQNFTYARIFDFLTGLDTVSKGKVSNIQGGSLRLEPTDEDVLLNRDERFRAEIPPGAFQTDEEAQHGLDAGATTQFTLEVRRARSRQQASAQYLRRLGAVPVHLDALSSRSYPEGLYRAMASSAATPMSAFYDVFLPLGIRSQLKKAVDLTLSYDLTGSSATASDLNVWYYNTAQGRYVLENTNRRVDEVNKTLTVTVDHFSTFVVLASTPVLTSTTPYTGGEIEVFNFPNPFDCIRHTKSLNSRLFGGRPITFDGTMIHYGLPAGDSAELKVKIYDVAGELVREIPQGELGGGFTYYSPWDCKNEGGKSVASGVYIGQIKWGGRNKFFKMAVIKGSGL
ncbi:MAG: hypothetical protein WC986_04015 [Elusimicrobiota bacterium]